MSRFSGKCDFYDYLDEKRIQDIIDGKLNVYTANNIVPLRISSPKDLIPYYPYLIAASGFNSDTGKGGIHLSSSSFVDREEEETLNCSLKNALRYYRRCKRKKLPYNIEEAAQYAGGMFVDEVDREIAARVGTYGEKATINGLSLPMSKIYREALYKEMMDNGYKKVTAWYWVYHEYNRELMRGYLNELKEGVFDEQR